MQHKNILFNKLHKNYDKNMLKITKKSNTLNKTIQAAIENHYKEGVAENKKPHPSYEN